MKRVWFVIVYCLLLSSLLAGCAELPAPPSDTTRAEWGNLVVVPARFTPQSNIRSFAVGKGEGAAKGAATGSAAGAIGTMIFATGGAAEMFIAPYLAVVMIPVGAAVGAISGSQAAITEEQAAKLETYVEQNLAALRVPDTLVRAIIDTTRLDTDQQLTLLTTIGPTAVDTETDYTTLAQQGVDTVLEVIPTEVGFIGGKQLRFYLVADVRLVHVKNGEHIYEREFVYQSDYYDAALWAENQAALLGAELQRSYTSLAQSVVEHIFLLTPLPQATLAKVTSEEYFLGAWDACGLAWVSPEHDFHPKLSDYQALNWNRFPLVASRQPTLVWEAFPQDSDRRSNKKALLSNVSNVRYDVRVWQALNNAPPRLVYERRNLPQPSHTLEQSLLAKSRYFWSARARFDLEGKVHATKWGYFRTPNYALYGDDKIKPESSPASVVGAFTAGMTPRDVCTLDFIPTKNYYRFQTP